MVVWLEVVVLYEDEDIKLLRIHSSSDKEFEASRERRLLVGETRRTPTTSRLKLICHASMAISMLDWLIAVENFFQQVKLEAYKLRGDT
jgi:hypothetical protein